MDENGDVQVDDSAERAAEIIKRVADEAAPEGMSNNKEDQARLGFESGSSDFEVNYTFVWASAAEAGTQKTMGFARYPRVDKDKPSQVTLGGINLGISAYSKHPDLAFEAAQCIAKPENQVVAAELGGLRAVHRVALRRPEGQEGVPVRRPDAAVDRRGRAAAGQPGVLGHLAGDPEDVPSA